MIMITLRITTTANTLSNTPPTISIDGLSVMESTVTVIDVEIYWKWDFQRKILTCPKCGYIYRITGAISNIISCSHSDKVGTATPQSHYSVASS